MIHIRPHLGTQSDNEAGMTDSRRTLTATRQ
jgi:hypothetical protein